MGQSDVLLCPEIVKIRLTRASDIFIEFFLVGIADRDIFVSDPDPVVFNAGYPCKGYNKRFMASDKSLRQ